MTVAPKPVVLMILDGFGHSDSPDSNAIMAANTPVWDKLWATAPHTLVSGSGMDVGLPDGQMGNSEGGHMNLGAGRIVIQDLPRINATIAAGELAGNPQRGQFIEKLKKSGGTCHLMGLVSPGGVHSHQDHFPALAAIVAGAGVPVAVHAFLDGRDTPPKSAKDFLTALGVALQEADGSERILVATVCGRYYAMDRDRRWDRIEKATRALVEASGDRVVDPINAAQASYAQGVTDGGDQGKGRANRQVEDRVGFVFHQVRQARGQDPAIGTEAVHFPVSGNQRAAGGAHGGSCVWRIGGAAV